MPKIKTVPVYSTAIITISMLMVTVFFNLQTWTSSATDSTPPVIKESAEEERIEAAEVINPEPEPEIQEEPPFEGNINSLFINEIIDFLDFLQAPIAGAAIHMTNGQLPGAPRSYRNGTHQGVDFYNGFSGTTIARGTPVLAAAAGEVIRIDHSYIEMTSDERAEYHSISAAAVTTPDYLLDKYRGRQVWIKHQDQVITRYAHLDTVESELSVGDYVLGGSQIGTVGNSGTGPAITGENKEMHLHFEIWLNENYLGQGLAADDIRHILRQILK